MFAQATGMTGVDGYWPHDITYDAGISVVTNPLASSAYTEIVSWGTPGQTVEYEYDPVKRRVKSIAVDAVTTTLGYRGDGRQDITNVVVTESATARIDSTFDSDHHVQTSGFGYNGTGPASTNTWGTDDTLTSVTDPDGVTTVFTYDGVKLTDVDFADGSSVSNAYGDCLLSSVTPSWGPEVAYDRDSWHHVDSVTVGCRTYDMTVDELGRVWDITYPDGGSESFTYGASSAPDTHVDRGGRTTTYDYEPDGHLSKVTRGGIDVLTIDYEQQMQALAITDALGRDVEGYVLDDQYRPVTVTNVEGQTMSVTYKVGGFLDSITRFDGTGVSFAYNTGGQVSSVTYPGPTVLSFGYTPGGRLTSAVNPVGTVGISYAIGTGQPVAVSGVGPAAGSAMSYTTDGFLGGYTNVAGAWTNTYSGWLLATNSGPQGTFALGYDGCDQLSRSENEIRRTCGG